MRAVTAEVADYNRAFEDRSTYARMRDEFVTQSRPLLESGVDVIIPAGGYPMLLFGQEPGFAIDGATLLNGFPVAVAAAATAVRLRRRSGTSAGRCGAYGLPAPRRSRSFASCSATCRQGSAPGMTRGFGCAEHSRSMPAPIPGV